MRTLTTTGRLRNGLWLVFLFQFSCTDQAAEQLAADLEPAMELVSDHYLSRENTHNRWNRDLEPVLVIKSGDTITVETKDASDGYYTVDSTSADIPTQDRSKVHPLTGPIFVQEAQPGDVLQIDILSFQLSDWGWTQINPPLGFLGDEFQEPFLQIWRFNKAGGYADMRPGVRVSIENPFLGVIGVAWDEEGEFRTIPPRTHGGNMDIKHLKAGTTLYLPVALPGALLSVGDGHAAQGDGEVCLSAIECDLTAQLRVTIRRDKRIQEPHYEGPDFYATTGFATTIDEAARKATRYLIDYLVDQRGFTRHQAYVLSSVAADLQINETVDMPHYLVSARLPKSVFQGPD